MAVFTVSFRIKDDSTGDDRRKSFVDAVNKESGNDNWDETTSYHIFKSTKSASALCSSLYTGSSFDSSKDIMVVIDLTNKKWAQKGAREPTKLGRFLDNIG